MNWEAAGAIGEIVGALAVVASLAFVGFQLLQSTRATRLATTNEILTQFEAIIEMLALDEGVAELMLRGVPEPASLEGLERYRFTLMCQRTHFYFAKAHYQYRSGTLEPEMWAAIRSQMGNFMNSPGMSQYWEKHGWNYPEAFRTFMQEEILVGADAGWSLSGTGMPTPARPTGPGTDRPGA